MKPQVMNNFSRARPIFLLINCKKEKVHNFAPEQTKSFTVFSHVQDELLTDQSQFSLIQFLIILSLAQFGNLYQEKVVKSTDTIEI